MDLFGGVSEESLDQIRSWRSSGVGKSPSRKKGLSIRNENDANILGGSWQAKGNLPHKHTIFEDKKFNKDPENENVLKLIIKRQKREINKLKKQHAFFMLKNHGKNLPHEKNQDCDRHRSSKMKSSTAKDASSMFSPKRRRFENEELSDRERYLSDVRKSNIFDTPPRSRARSRDIPSTPPTTNEKSQNSIFERVMPSSSSRPPKSRHLATEIEELCEHRQNEMPSTPIASLHRNKPNSLQKPVPSTGSTLKEKPFGKAPASASPLTHTFGSKTANAAGFKQNFHFPQTKSVSHENRNLEELMSRLNDLESEIHNMTIAADSTVNAFPHKDVDHSSGLKASIDTRSNTYDKKSETKGRDEDIPHSPLSSPPPKDLKMKYNTETIPPNGITVEFTGNREKESPNPLSSMTTPLSPVKSSDCKVEKTTEVDSNMGSLSKESDKEFQNFCRQLSQASSPEEVQNILQNSQSTISMKENKVGSADDINIKNQETPVTSNLKSPGVQSLLTPVSVTNILSPLGSHGVGTASKVAISDLSTYQSKLTSWRKRYPASTSGINK